MKTKFFIFGFLSSILILVLVVFFMYKHTVSYQENELNQIIKKSPDTLSIKVISVNNLSLEKFKPLNLNNVKYNDIIIINFWATWCAPCVRELPEFNKLVSKFRNKNISFIFASKEEVIKINTFTKNNLKGYNLPFYRYKENEISKTFDHTYIPTTYLINRKTNIAFQVNGIQNWNSDLIIKLVNTLSINNDL